MLLVVLVEAEQHCDCFFLRLIKALDISEPIESLMIIQNPWPTFKGGLSRIKMTFGSQTHVQSRCSLAGVSWTYKGGLSSSIYIFKAV